MRFLLDTHVFLWYLTGAKTLKPLTRELLRDPRHPVFVSPVSLWEALVKHHLGKLDLPDDPGAYLSQTLAVILAQGAKPPGQLPFEEGRHAGLDARFPRGA